MSNVSFDDLVEAVHTTSVRDDDLARLEAAALISAALTDTGEALLGHFVERCRTAGCSWAQIGTALGVTRQAAQQRFVGVSMDRFTARTRHVVEVAQGIADDEGAATLRLEHLAPALFSEPASIGARVLVDLGVTREALEEAIGRRSRARGARLGDAPPVGQALLAAALELGHNYIGTEHILLACHRDAERPVARALGDVGAPASAVRAAVLAAVEAARSGGQ